MTVQVYLAFVVASALLVLTPGPMVAYLVATTLTHGLRHGLMALIGSAVASAVQLTIVVAGLSFILAVMSEAFIWLKWIGVAYLAYLGVKALRMPTDELVSSIPLRSEKRTIAEAFFVNLTNPEGVIVSWRIFTFIYFTSGPCNAALVLLAITFVVLAAILDGCWAVFAALMQPLLMRIGRWRHRITGGILLAAAAGIALVRK